LKSNQILTSLHSWATLNCFWEAHNLLTGSMDRDFGTLWELLGILSVASLRSRGFQTLQMWSSELSGGSPPTPNFKVGLDNGASKLFFVSEMPLNRINIEIGGGGAKAQGASQV